MAEHKDSLPQDGFHCRNLPHAGHRDLTATGAAEEQMSRNEAHREEEEKTGPDVEVFHLLGPVLTENRR